jgi:hypothetical protein
VFHEKLDVRWDAEGRVYFKVSGGAVLTWPACMQAYVDEALAALSNTSTARRISAQYCQVLPCGQLFCCNTLYHAPAACCCLLLLQDYTHYHLDTTLTQVDLNANITTFNLPLLGVLANLHVSAEYRPFVDVLLQAISRCGLWGCPASKHASIFLG